LFAAIVAAVVEESGAAVGQDVDELPPQIVAFAGVERLFRNVLHPFDWLGGKMPIANGPFFIAPGKTAEAWGRFFGPDIAFAGIWRSGRGIDDGDPAVFGAAQQLQAPYPSRSPIEAVVGRIEDDAALRGGFFVELLSGNGLG